MSHRFKYFALGMIYLLAALAGQWLYGAYGVEPGEHGDESSHIVTGLMIRDWLGSGLPTPVMGYAERYYLHYPRVALGHWPPLFYVLQAGWTLLAGSSQTSLFQMMAMLTTVLCARTAWAVNRIAPGWAGWATGFLLLALPPVVQHTGMVMAEILLCWLCLETVLAWAAWMEAPGWGKAAWFGFWAVGACLTKVTAAWLAPMALLAVLASPRRWWLLRQPTMWITAALIAALTLPWYLLAPGALHQASQGVLGVLDARNLSATMRLARRLREAGELFGILAWWLGPLLGAAFWGIGRLWRQPRALGQAVAASVGAMLMMRFLVMATGYEDRTAMPLLAPLLVAAAGAIPDLRRRPLASMAAVLAFAIWGLLGIPPKRAQGVEAATSACLRPEYRNAVLMVAADSFREGALVADVALHEKRPGHYVMRASKLMSKSMWAGHRYELLIKDVPQVMQVIENLPVGLLIVQADPRRWRTQHQRLVADTVAAYPDRFRLVQAGPMRVYQVKGFAERPQKPVSIHLYGLGRAIEGAAR